MAGPEIEGLSASDVEAAVRRYLAKVARRYTPLAIGLASLLVVVAVVPTVSPTSGRFAGGNSPAAGAITGAGENGGDAATAGTEAAAAAASATGGGTSGGGRRVAAGAVPITPPAKAGAAGVTRSGVNCGPGVRQVTWSKYAPICIPAYSGNNGGGTSHGVSGDTITLSFRRTTSAEEQAAFAAAGRAKPGSDDDYLSDLRTYVDLFNKNFELYGRHVVVKDFDGQGDNLEEDQGRDRGGAETDAATAADKVGAFADITQSPTLAYTQPYAEHLTAHKVIGVGGLGLPAKWFRDNSPYQYSFISPDGDKAADAAIRAICNRAVGMPAIYAGDAAYQATNRVWGLVAPENDVYQYLADKVQHGVEGCGGSIVQRDSYAIDISQFQQESTLIVAHMHNHAPPVSSVICICDPIVEIFLSNNANSQGYSPEWWATPWLDPQGSTTNQDEWAHAISGEGTAVPRAQREAYRAFKLAKPTEEPKEQYFDVAYFAALYTFSALQISGPNLNPSTFQQGVFGMPRSERGDAGIWSGGREAWSPQTESQIGKWHPEVTSNFDGQQGGWISCEGGNWFSLSDPNAFGGRRQLQC